MARPRVNHDGFLVPNAGDVASPKMAEPDRIDFNTVGNNRWGVIKDCLVTVAGATASTLGGVAVVDGNLVRVNGASALLGVGAGQDRFDLVVVDTNGTLKVLPGDPSTDPVFPDPGTAYTVLAAVFCPSGSANFVDNVMDKRNMLSDSLLTSILANEVLIRNQDADGVGDIFQVTGDGRMLWGGDTHMYRVSAETLRIIRNLLLDGDLTVGGSIVAEGAISANGEISGSNLTKGSTLPVTAEPGDLFQHEVSGRLYKWTNGEWEEMATLSGAVPVGAVIQSLVGPDVMGPMGWVALRGQPIQRADYPSLFDIPALASYITGDTMVMPNASQRVLVTDFNAPGQTGGSKQVTLSQANLPSHNHGIVMGTGGSHDHAVTTHQAGSHSHSVGGGEHSHGVSDPGHSHNGADMMGTHTSVIAVVWGGQNKIDALFNDRSHTYSVEPLSWMAAAYTGLQVNAAGSGHGHNVAAAGDHTHGTTVSAHPGHTHPLSVQTVGQGVPFNVDPPYLTVYTYIRS